MQAWTSTVTTLTILVAVSMTPAAYAFDLTGHWAGKFSCKGFDGTKITLGSKAATLAITQTGNTIAALAGGFLYTGTQVPDPAKPEQGEAVLFTCATSGTTGIGEIGRATVKTKLGTFKATLKATSVFATNAPRVGTCKYTYKRIDTIDPGVGACS